MSLAIEIMCKLAVMGIVIYVWCHVSDWIERSAVSRMYFKDTIDKEDDY